MLRHATTGLFQRVILETRTLETTLNGVKACQFMGVLKLMFNAQDYPDVPAMSHVLGDSWYIPSTGLGRLSSPMVGDAQVYFWRDGTKWRGNWYSKIYGYIGELTLGQSELPTSLDETIFVPSFTGIYNQSPQHNIRVERKLVVNAFGDTSDSHSFDASRQFKTSGSMETRVVDPNGEPGMDVFATLDTVTYNYFTGKVTFVGPNHYFKGTVKPNRLIVKTMTKKYGADYMPSSWTWDFLRLQQ